MPRPSAERTAARPGRAPPPTGGFTLIEIMVVMLLIGIMLLWLPARARRLRRPQQARLDGRTLVSVLTAAREMAIIDGHEVRLQVELAPDLEGPHADRALPLRGLEQDARDARRVEGARSRGEASGTRRTRARTSGSRPTWRALPEGVLLTGYSPGERRLDQQQPARRADRGLLLPRRRGASAARVAHHLRRPRRGRQSRRSRSASTR